MPNSIIENIINYILKNHNEITTEYIDNIYDLLPKGKIYNIDIFATLCDCDRMDLIEYATNVLNQNIDLSINNDRNVSPKALDMLLSINTSTKFYRSFIVKNIKTVESAKIFSDHNFTFEMLCDIIKYPMINNENNDILLSFIKSDTSIEIIHVFFSKIYNWWKYDLKDIDFSVEKGYDIDNISDLIHNLDITTCNHLLNLGCDIDKLFNNVIVLGHIDTIKELLAKGVIISEKNIVNFANSDYYDDEEIIQMILDHGIDLYYFVSLFDSLNIGLINVLSKYNIDWNVVIASIILHNKEE